MSKTNQKILNFLAKYKFGTHDLFLKAGVGTQKTHISSAISRLIESKRVEKIQEAVNKPAYFYLTKKGAGYVEGMWGIEAHYPKDKRDTISDKMTHHIRTIEFRIEIEQSEKVVQCESYLDNQTTDQYGNPARRTLVEGVEPDLVFSLETPRGYYWYLYEFENMKDFKNTWMMIESHVDLMGTGEVQKKYGFDYGYRVLVEVAQPTILKRVLDKAKEDKYLQYLSDNFLFWKVDTWVNTEGSPTLLY